MESFDVAVAFRMMVGGAAMCNAKPPQRSKMREEVKPLIDIQDR
jgi:hypothetical protein